MKKALVTGASKGIGRATAIALAQNGYSVAINYNTSRSDAEEVLGECDTYSEGNFIVQADISQEDMVDGMYEKVKEEFGSLDVLVNNAGIINSPDSYQNIAA